METLDMCSCGFFNNVQTWGGLEKDIEIEKR